jgi:GNAT superfamily N-acetyltransferase
MSYYINEERIDPKTFNEIENIEIAIKNSKYMVLAKDEDHKVIGMARVIGDEGLIFYIQDVIVLPEFQGKGIGKMLIENILEYLEQYKGQKIKVGLMAAKEKEGFYKQYGFVERPNERDGCEMIKKL